MSLGTIQTEPNQHPNSHTTSKAQDDGYENTVGGASDEIAGAIIGDVLGGSGDGGDFTDYLPDFVTDIFGGN